MSSYGLHVGAPRTPGACSSRDDPGNLLGRKAHFVPSHAPTLTPLAAGGSRRMGHPGAPPGWSIKGRHPTRVNLSNGDHRLESHPLSRPLCYHLYRIPPGLLGRASIAMTHLPAARLTAQSGRSGSKQESGGACKQGKRHKEQTGRGGPWARPTRRGRHQQNTKHRRGEKQKPRDSQSRRSVPASVPKLFCWQISS